MWNAVRFLSGEAEADSDLRILPLVALAEHYKARRSDPNVGLHLDRQWASGSARLKAQDLFDQGWFERARVSYPMPVPDMSYLAHALFVGDEIPPDADVLKVMEPFAFTMPWSLFGDPVRQLSRTRQGRVLPSGVAVQGARSNARP